MSPVVCGEDGFPVDLGPSGGPCLALVTRWRVSPRQSLADASAMGNGFRRFEAGLQEWTAELDLLWNADEDGSAQRELWMCLLDEDVPGTLALTLFVEGTAPGGKKAYHGPALLTRARVLTARDDLTRMRVEAIGIGALRYRSGLFAEGSFGAHEGYAGSELNGCAFAEMETLAEHPQ